jgi:hypothetical protein
MKTSDFTIHVLDIEERKRQIAYALWEDEGRPEGRAEAHWQEACRIVEEGLKDPDWLKRSVTAQAEVQTPQTEGSDTKRSSRKAA